MEMQLGERKKTMAEDPISSFCDELAAFCNHLHSSSDALKQSVDRRPIPLGTLLSLFLIPLSASSANSIQILPLS